MRPLLPINDVEDGMPIPSSSSTTTTTTTTAAAAAAAAAIVLLFQEYGGPIDTWKISLKQLNLPSIKLLAEHKSCIVVAS
jgi:cobalamin biosynthesis protein CbiD